MLITVTLSGASEQMTAWALDATGHSSRAIAADAGPLEGTIVVQQSAPGFVAVDRSQPVEPGASRPAFYRGASFSDYI